MKIATDAMVSAAIVGTLLCPNICDAIGRDNGSLRRKRNANIVEAQLPRRAISATEFRLVPDEQMKLDPEDHLEDLWSRAMAVEEEMKLDERLLQMSASYSFSLSMSMPSRPPASAPSGSSFPSSTPSFESSSNDCFDGKSRGEYILTILSSITDADIINDPSTPQGQAFEWIVEKDPLAVNPCTYPTIAQRYGLATFYYSTVGTDWLKNDDWLGGLEECKWLGVTCGGQSKTTVEKLQLRKFKCKKRAMLRYFFSSLLTLLAFHSIKSSRWIPPR